jgi:hypothetical protein
MFKKPKRTIAIAIFLVGVVYPASAQGQLAIVKVTLGPDQIATIKAAQGITTRVSFPEPVKEIICGDLYDPATGKGGFVVQRSENDVFLKPIPTRGMTNLFVKTGEKGDHIYNFDLIIGPVNEAHRVVNVTAPPISPPPGSTPRRGQQPGDQGDDTLSRARQQAADIEKNANQQAGRIIAEAEQKASDLKRQAAEKAAETERLARQRADEIETRFVYALMDGSREIKVNHPHVAAKNVVVTLDRRVIIFDGKSYLRYMIQNNGTEDFEFNTISIETGLDKDEKTIAANVIQDKPENKVAPKETIRGVIVFNSDVVKDKTRLTMYVRGQDNAEIARVNIQ